jgi:hypothetical protein
VVSLSWPFPFYGASYSALVVSPNGYLAFADSLAKEDGRDFSNHLVGSVPSALFPSGSPVFSFAGRALVYHDDLTSQGGSVRAQAFDPCPRPSESLGVEPCTVVSWEGVSPVGFGESLSFQALLYHQSGQLVFQYATPDPTGGASATVGIQQEDPGHAGLAYGENEAGRLSPGLGVCFFHPWYPPGGPAADLQLQADLEGPVTDPGPFALPFTLVNQGPSPATGTTVSLQLPAGVLYAGDDCGGFASGSWAVGTLAPGAAATCTLQLVNSGGGIVTLTTSSAAADPQPANNTFQLEALAPDDGDGVEAKVEDSYPGGDGFPRFAPGDGNGDGIPDRQQATVATLPLASGKGWVTVEVLDCSGLQQVSTATEADNGIPDPAYDYPWGLVRFRVPCPAATVKLWYHLTDAPSPTYRALDPNGRWQTLPATRVRERFLWVDLLSLADGSAGDGERGDGAITHRGGPATPAPNPGKR